MTITNPLAWGLLLLAVPIILFFFLKVRFRKEFVATTIFWQQVFEERRTRTLRRQFRHLVSLLLALLFLSLLVAAALDPVADLPENDRYVIIIDNSASMNALLSATGPTRLDYAKQQAAARLNRTAAGQQVAILTANINPQIVSGFTDHIGTLRRRLAEIPATDFPGDLSAALYLAEQLIAEQPNALIYVYTTPAPPREGNSNRLSVGGASDSAGGASDSAGGGGSPPVEGGHFAEQNGGAVSLRGNVQITPIGQPIDNLAITRFQPRRSPGQAADYEILVEVVNFGEETVQAHLEIDREGELVDVIPLALEPNLPVTRIIRNTSAAGGLLRGSLASADPDSADLASIAPASIDRFPTDNVAIAFLSEQFVQRILLYGRENFFLWNVLQVQPLTTITVIDTIPDTIPPDSVLVLHQVVPETLPSGNVLVIDPQYDSDLFRVEQRLERPMATNISTENSLVRFIQPGLVFAGARNIIPQRDNVHVLAETADVFPLYLQFISDNQRVLVLSADLNQGDLALRTAFPILISQALTYFRDSEALLKAYSTAEPVTLTVQTEQTQVILRSPSGREEMFPTQSGAVSLGKLGEVGVWTILEPETYRLLARIACNLFNPAESNLRLVAEVSVQSAEAGTLLARPIWHYLALLALLLAVAEWFLYQRRWVE